MAAHAPKALRGRASIIADAPELRPLSPNDLLSAHVWHSDDGDALDVWCVLGSSEARALLRIVLQGPAGDELTPLERNIVRDTLERLLATTGRVWEERAASQLPPSAGWRCRLTLTDNLGTSSTFSLHAPSSSAPERPRARVDLHGIPVMLEASLPSIEMHVDAIVRWRAGDVIALTCAPDVAVQIRAGDAPVGTGSLGVARGRRAILVTRSG